MKGFWRLKSPLPDCEAGVIGVRVPTADEEWKRRWHFRGHGVGMSHSYTEEEMRRNPDIFEWVEERAEWPGPEEAYVGRGNGDRPNVIVIPCRNDGAAARGLAAVRAMLTALGFGEDIYAGITGCHKRLIIRANGESVRPDGKGAGR